jgi:hypothetical protein
VAGAIETEESSFARLLTPPSKTQVAPATTMPMMTLRIEENRPPAPIINVERKNELVVGAFSPTGTMAIDTEAKQKQGTVAVIDVNRSLAATLDTYHIDLSKPSERQPVPPEPEWLDDGDLEEVYSVDPRSNPAALYLGKPKQSPADV